MDGPIYETKVHRLSMISTYKVVLISSTTALSPIQIDHCSRLCPGLALKNSSFQFFDVWQEDMLMAFY